MKIKVQTSLPAKLMVVRGIFQDKKGKPDLDKKTVKVLGNEEFKGEFKEYREICDVRNILLLGLGKRKDYTSERARKAGAVATRKMKKIKLKKFAFKLFDESPEAVQALVEGMLLANYSFDRYKTKKPKGKVEDCILVCSAKNERAVKKAVRKAKILCEAVYLVRDLINTPSLDKRPPALAKYYQSLAKKHGIKCTVFDDKQLKKMGMNTLLAVGRGSSAGTRLVVLEYKGGKDTIALVGKGITFDSGGLNLKPGRHMEDMKIDMAGSATVVGTILAAKHLKLPINVVAVAALAENMPGGDAIRPGDVIKSYSGKTIEILNTDAEGRLVLADALAYTEKKYKPKAIVDVATLTGAVVVCLGYYFTGLITNDKALGEKIKSAGKKTFERVWKLPLVDEFREDIKGDISDVKNIGGIKGYEGGTITAGAFLETFVENTNWAHLDVAGTAWSLKDEDYSRKGATGTSVRLLVQFLEDWKK